MARGHRIQFPGIIYHVFSRGNEKMNIYKNENDRRYFMKLVSIAKQKYKFRLYAYALMPNHYHILIRPEEGLLSRIMQYINGRYGHYFNWRNHRSGHLFEKRYKNIAVEDSDYLFEAVRYIHLNPVRKRMVESPDGYEWCSHSEYIKNEKPALVDRDYVLEMFGENKKTAVNAFRRFVGNSKDLPAVEAAAGYIDGLVSGSRKFAEEVLEKAVKNNLSVPAWVFRGNRAEPGAIMDKTARVFDVSRHELINKKGKWNFAKKAAIYMMWRNTSLGAVEIAGLFNKLHYTVIGRTIKNVENEIAENEEFKNKIDSIQLSLSVK
jgi:REP element-mobilizing transposase RayT